MGSPRDKGSITEALQASVSGETEGNERLLALIYDDLRRLARGKLAHLGVGQTLQTTALVHEAWMRVSEGAQEDWQSRSHFFGAAARAMRNILVDQARRKATVKHGGDRKRVEEFEPSIEPPAEDMLALDESLALLERLEPRKAQVVMLRFFTGLTTEAIADVQQVSVATVERDWRFARAWLQEQIDGKRESRA